MKAKDDMFKKFSQYIITRCWPKMWQHVDSWSSKGFIYCLANIPEDTIRYAFSRYQESPQQDLKRTDYGFATTFMQTVKHGLVKEILKARPSPGGKLDHLTAALTKVVKIEEGKEKGKGKGKGKGEQKLEPEEPIILYDTQTCTEFHNFLVAILIAYGKALAEFSTVMTSQSALKIKQQNAINFWNIAIMLWKTAHSQILQQHLTTLQMIGCLSMPNFSKKDMYKAFVNWQDEGKGKGKGKGKGMGMGHGQGEDQRKDNGEGNGEEEDEVTLEVGLGKQYSSDQPYVDQAVAYQRWIRLLAHHFISLDILSKYCNRSGNQRIEISLLAVQHPCLKDTMDWLPVIRKLGSHSRLRAARSPTDINLDVERIIKVLQEYIGSIATNSSAGTNKNSSKEHSICNAFHCGPASVYFGEVHSEVVLASARKYPDLVAMDRGYLNILAVRPQLY